ncbi:MAG TPA: response regulator [Polyangia bacterium]|nr:response regulator [Polyangia bacterium]
MSQTEYILLVDDDPDLRQCLVDILEDEGFVTQTAGTGREALALLQSPHLPSLILLDLMMPELNGWQFYERQQSDPRLAPIPVLVVTANRGTSAGIPPGSDVLWKPFSAESVLNKVHGLIAPTSGPAPPH